uniref:Small ribosomal subunit protein mS23 n=1 Tax=Mola mola TaxID=94237 RepID=A0A3Q3WCG3_MOLML
TAGAALLKFSRGGLVRDLMRSGVIKPQEKPIWYDVYGAFPPKREPLHVKSLIRPCTKKDDTVPEIFYGEDAVRARFFVLYGMGPRPFDLSKSNFVSTCQRFVEKYTEFKSYSELDDATAFEETGKALLTDGIVLRRRGAPSVRDLQPEHFLNSPVLTGTGDELIADRRVESGSRRATPGPSHTP